MLLIKTKIQTIFVLLVRLFVCLFVFSPLYRIALARSLVAALAKSYMRFEDTSRVND